MNKTKLISGMVFSILAVFLGILMFYYEIKWDEFVFPSVLMIVGGVMLFLASICELMLWRRS